MNLLHFRFEHIDFSQNKCSIHSQITSASTGKVAVKAGVLKKVNEINYTSVEDPELHPGDLLLWIRAATVCGTDIRVFRGRKTAGIRYPCILGHEFAGEIVDTGGNPQFSIGQSVCVCPAIACGHCAYCIRGIENLCRNLTAMGYELDGGFAEYVRVPARGVSAGNVFAVPDGISFEQAALATAEQGSAIKVAIVGN